MFEWIPRKLRYALGVVAVLSLLVPTGISHDTVITGHTVFKNAAGYDKCLASVVGLARSQVLWFNDMALVETDPKGQYLYAVRGGAVAPPPLQPNNQQPIFGDGVVYEFIDPNGHRWVVLEGYYYTRLDVKPSASVALLPNPSPHASAGGNVTVESVWIVQIGPTFRDANPGSDAHEFYNFVTLIDTCKFGHGSKPEANLTHAAGDPNHPPGETEHNHDVYEVDLYIGRAPTFVPAGANATNPAVYSEFLGRVSA